MSGKKLLVAAGVVILGVALYFAGTSFAQSGANNDDNPGWPGRMGSWGYGWMHERGNGPQAGPGFPDHMNGRDHHGAMQGTYGDMMGNWDSQASGDDVEPLSLEEAEAALTDYLAEAGEERLTVGEIMIFNNHAYGQIVDANGTGAFELLVEPITGRAYPEPGPNMMWNTEYGHMSGGMMGGQYGNMMSGFDSLDRDVDASPDIDAVEAVGLAQTYLDEFVPGAAADEHADAFPGYYTLHILRDGQVVDMLSVNAFSGDVFPHTWHGDFVEMAESHVE